MDPINALYQEYVTERNIPLVESDFISLLNLFPSILVLSDSMTKEEKFATINKIAHLVAVTKASKQASCAESEIMFCGEFIYLRENKEKWRNKFLFALKKYIEQIPSARGIIIKTMETIGEMSAKVDYDLCNKINVIAKELGVKAKKNKQIIL